MNDERLERLRRRIRNLDAALLSMIAERMELAREIGEVKSRAGIPLRDFEVEKRVLDRARSAADDLGLAPEVARDIMRQLIEEACRVQEEAHFARAVAGAAESILVVGGMGKMGRWFARFFANQGHRVAIFDPVAGDSEFPRPASLAAGLAAASLVVVAVPLDRVGATIREIGEAGFDGIVFDVASLKQHLRADFDHARARGLRVTSIHPMFGPGARTLSDKVICVCDCGDAEATARVTALFRETAARIVALSLEEHDRIAARVLGLSHFVNLVFATALAGSGFSLAELSAVGSTTFQAQLATTANVLHEPPELYYSIQKLNPETPEVHAAMIRAVADWARAVAAGDRAAFAKAMGEARRWLEAGDSEAGRDRRQSADV